jgi:hypothetical protein
VAEFPQGGIDSQKLENALKTFSDFLTILFISLQIYAIIILKIQNNKDRNVK